MFSWSAMLGRIVERDVFGGLLNVWRSRIMDYRPRGNGPKSFRASKQMQRSKVRLKGA